jgi:hypothetical protein
MKRRNFARVPIKKPRFLFHGTSARSVLFDSYLAKLQLHAKKATIYMVIVTYSRLNDRLSNLPDHNTA